MHRKDSGYSLAELLAVVFVLSVATAVAIPNFAASDPNELELAAQEFAQAIRFARSEAIRTGEPRGFHQQSPALRIRVFRLDTAASPWAAIYDVIHPISKKPYDISLGSHPFARAESMTNDRVWRGSCSLISYVYFDAMGVPRCIEPSTVLVEKFAFTLALGAHTRTVTLDGITGRVTVQ